MEKIDRLGWTVGFSFESFGLRIGVRSNSVSMIEQLRASLPWGARRARGRRVDRLYSFLVGGEDDRQARRRVNVLYCDWTVGGKSERRDELVEWFAVDAKMTTAEFSPNFTFIHAGVVEWHGRAIIIPGKSHSGKSTLVAALVRAGARYFSDEYALVDERGLIHPYAAALSLREERFGRQVSVPLPGKRGRGVLEPGLVVIAPYKEGSRSQIRPLSRGEGTLELLRNAVSGRRQTERALASLARLAERADFFRGARGEADRFAARLLEMATRSESEAESL